MKRKKVASYKGYDILDRDGTIAVNKPGADWKSDFLVDLDDSKMSGNRKSVGMSYKEQLKAAKGYIDWLMKKESITEDSSKLQQIADKYGLDISKYDTVQLIKGMRVEKEHDSNPDTDVVNNVGDLMKIAMAHLDELPDYYDRLEKMENEVREVVKQEIQELLDEGKDWSEMEFYETWIRWFNGTASTIWWKDNERSDEDVERYIEYAKKNFPGSEKLIKDMKRKKSLYISGKKGFVNRKTKEEFDKNVWSINPKKFPKDKTASEIDKFLMRPQWGYDYSDDHRVWQSGRQWEQDMKIAWKKLSPKEKEAAWKRNKKHSNPHYYGKTWKEFDKKYGK